MFRRHRSPSVATSTVIFVATQGLKMTSTVETCSHLTVYMLVAVMRTAINNCYLKKKLPFSGFYLEIIPQQKI